MRRWEATCFHHATVFHATPARRPLLPPPNFSRKYTSDTIHFPISGHLPIFLNSSLPLPSKNPTKFEFRHVTSESKHIFSQNLNNIDWNVLLSSRYVNNNFNNFLNKINELYNHCFPLRPKYISENRLQNPWITSSGINSVKTKNNLYRKAL